MSRFDDREVICSSILQKVIVYCMDALWLGANVLQRKISRKSRVSEGYSTSFQGSSLFTKGFVSMLADLRHISDHFIE